MSVNKAAIVRQIEERFKETFPSLSGVGNSGHCIRWAAVSCSVLKEEYNIDAFIEAGSMNWPVIPPELDDGISPTHFSYEFDLTDPASQLSIAIGGLPEMHAWTYLPQTKEILDLTTRHLIEQCAKTAPYMKWVFRPPQYLWEHEKNLPAGTYYTAELEARKIAQNAARSIMPGFSGKLDFTP